MVQRYSTYGCDWECETYEDDRGELVKYEDYEKLAKSVRACVAAIREGSLTVEHVQGYLEGVIGVLDD